MMQDIYSAIGNDIAFIVNQYGKDVIINSTPTKAMISYQKESVDHSDLKLITLIPLHTGDVVEYQGNKYLVVSEISNKKYDSYWVGIIRKCNVQAQYKTIEKVLIGTDPIGRPIYREIETLHDLPAIADNLNRTYNVDYGAINVIDNKIMLIIPDIEEYANIKENAQLVVEGKNYTVILEDLTRKGLKILTLERG
jgi:hypothetical protein